jgi:hypothetical protein
MSLKSAQTVPGSENFTVYRSQRKTRKGIYDVHTRDNGWRGLHLYTLVQKETHFLVSMLQQLKCSPNNEVNDA